MEFSFNRMRTSNRKIDRRRVKPTQQQRTRRKQRSQNKKDEKGSRKKKLQRREKCPTKEEEIDRDVKQGSLIETARSLFFSISLPFSLSSSIFDSVYAWVRECEHVYKRMCAVAATHFRRLCVCGLVRLTECVLMWLKWKTEMRNRQ